jgi:hypothetical protein
MLCAMNAPTLTLDVASIAVRLADEGVPVRAIARAVQLPSEALRETLHLAQAHGQLLTLPRDDWPVGFPRDQRSLQLSRMLAQDRFGMFLKLTRRFDLTTTEAQLLLLMLQHDRITKQQTRWSPKTVDVHICRIRKALARFGIEISTLWGHGYQLTPAARRRAFDLLLAPTDAA